MLEEMESSFKSFERGEYSPHKCNNIFSSQSRRTVPEMPIVAPKTTLSPSVEGPLFMQKLVKTPIVLNNICSFFKKKIPQEGMLLSDAKLYGHETEAMVQAWLSYP